MAAVTCHLYTKKVPALSGEWGVPQDTLKAGIFFVCNRIQVSKYADSIFMCISCYIYAYQLRCTKQVVLTTLKKIFLFPPPLQNQPSMAVCNSAGIHAVCGCTINRALRTTKLLPKVVICIIITGYTY